MPSNNYTWIVQWTDESSKEIKETREFNNLWEVSEHLNYSITAIKKYMKGFTPTRCAKNHEMKNIKITKKLIIAPPKKKQETSLNNCTWVVQWQDRDDPEKIKETKEFNTIAEMANYFGCSNETMERYIKGFRPAKWSNNFEMKYIKITKKMYDPSERLNTLKKKEEPSTNNCTWVVQWMDDYIPVKINETKEFNTIADMANYFECSVDTMKRYIKGFRPIKHTENYDMKNITIVKKMYDPSERLSALKKKEEPSTNNCTWVVHWQDKDDPKKIKETKEFNTIAEMANHFKCSIDTMKRYAKGFKPIKHSKNEDMKNIEITKKMYNTSERLNTLKKKEEPLTNNCTWVVQWMDKDSPEKIKEFNTIAEMANHFKCSIDTMKRYAKGFKPIKHSKNEDMKNIEITKKMYNTSERLNTLKKKEEPLTNNCTWVVHWQDKDDPKKIKETKEFNTIAEMANHFKCSIDTMKRYTKGFKPIKHSKNEDMKNIEITKKMYDPSERLNTLKKEWITPLKMVDYIWVVQWMDKDIPVKINETKEFKTIAEMANYFGYSIEMMKRYIKGFRPIKHSKNDDMKYITIVKENRGS